MKSLITFGTQLVLAILVCQVALVFGTIEPVGYTSSTKPSTAAGEPHALTAATGSGGSSLEAPLHVLSESDIHAYGSRFAYSSNNVILVGRTSRNIQKEFCVSREKSGELSGSYESPEAVRAFLDMETAEVLQKNNGNNYCISQLGSNVKVFILEHYYAAELFSQLQDADFSSMNVLVISDGDLLISDNILPLDRISKEKKFVLFRNHVRVHLTTGRTECLRYNPDFSVMSCNVLSYPPLSPCRVGSVKDNSGYLRESLATCCLLQSGRFSFGNARQCTTFSAESLVGVMANLREKKSQFHIMSPNDA